MSRYRVVEEDGEEFAALARTALAVLTERPGCLGGRVGRALDDAQLWLLSTEWESVGAYRRALSSYEVKVHAVPLMYRAIDEPSAFEELLTWTPGGELVEHEPSLAPDAGSAAPDRAWAPDAG